ncbi:hypothetical protein [Kribbella sp. NPDC003557]|uniref:hypothetical protein n=1 Tax=Kribbella sp. NPDC003557 TaxID=3154449 RepID=UPI0033A73896
MGAAIAIPLLTIILISLGYALWALFHAGTEAFTFAKSARRHGSGETAAHYDPGDHKHVSTKPPEGY